MTIEQSFSFSRPWREIAHELVNETSRIRLIELSSELSRAFEEQVLSCDGSNQVSQATLWDDYNSSADRKGDRPTP